jgi:hypothetical protein
MNPSLKKVRNSQHQMSKARSALETMRQHQGPPITLVPRAINLSPKP